MNKLVTLLLLGAAAVSIGSLLTGASYLERFLLGTLPIGNVLAAIAPCALAVVAFRLSPAHSACRAASRAAIIVSVLWLPFSVALAGNLALNFSGARGTAWIAMSLVTVAIVLGSLVCAVVGSVRGRSKRSSAA